MTRDIYLQPQAPDPVLAPETVLGIVRRFVPGASGVTAVDETGGEARAYMIDGDIVLKTQRPHRLRPRTSLEKEAFLLGHIARYADINVPRVLGYGQEGDTEYLCMTRMAGAAVRTLGLDGETRGRLLIDLGRCLARLHAMPQEELAASSQMPGDRDASAFEARMRAFAEQALAVFGAEPSIWSLDVPPEVMAAQLIGGLRPPLRLVTLHSNPGPEHVFADPETAGFTGVIDFGDAYISHAALDLRPWRPTEREVLLKGYAAEALLEPGDLRMWRSVLAIADMNVAALRPQRRAAALEGLGTAAAELL